MQDPQNSAKKPYVAIFGDNETQATTKAVWSLLSSHDLQMASVVSADELTRIAPGAVLILIAIQGVSDPHNALARQLVSDPRIVADIIALTKDATIRERMTILANGFDAIFNLEFMEYPEFKRVILNRVERGVISLENRMQQEEYRRFKAALAASPDAFIVFDENRKLFFVSEHYKNAYPVNGHRLVRGLDVMDAFEMCYHEQGVTRGDPRYKAMHDFWVSMDGEQEFKMDDGRIWSIKARQLPDGQGTIVTTSDITRYKTQEFELLEKSDKLSGALEKEQEASAIQKQFINMVSHEFRTPLTIIDGNAQILQRRAGEMDQDSITKRARTIRSAVSRLVNMMEGVLSSSMLKTGNLAIVPEELHLGQIVQELCDEYKDLSSSHNIYCDVTRLPDTVRADKKIVTLIISNLISNAVKFTKESPEISVTGWKEGKKICLSFEDNGIGIPENEIDKIFDRYYRTTTASGIPGSGIGLSLVRDLIELHKGKIRVESDMGKGAKFIISLPLDL